MTTEPKRPFWAKCGDENCGHCWPAAYLPMEAAKCAELLMRQACPMCGGKKVLVAKQADGVLNDTPGPAGAAAAAGGKTA
jgi:hypothetical protein